MATLVLLNNFLHDFGAAGWLFATVILWSILRRKDLHINNATIAAVIRIIVILMRISLIGIVVFGIFRALAYKNYEWSAAAGQSQVTLLIVKHLILTIIFIPGLIYYIRAVRLLRKGRDETA